jgi:hypothetical protein
MFGLSQNILLAISASETSLPEQIRTTRERMAIPK